MKSIVDHIYKEHPFAMIIHSDKGGKWYSIRVFDDTSYWVESNEGEGTQIKKGDLYNYVDKVFKKWM